jgi:cyanophycinase-like exopeptidase
LQLNKCGVKTAALVRATQTDSSNKEDALRKLKSADIRVMVGSPDGDQDKLAELLREFDTVVSDRRGERQLCYWIRL